MCNPAVQNNIKNFGATSEIKELDRFFETLRTEDDKVCYGIKSVNMAIDNNAVESMFVSDHLFRSKSTEVRQTYVKLVEKSERNGIKVMIFSSESTPGERLKNMTGVACILRFALPGLDDLEEDDEEDDDSDDPYINRSQARKEESKQHSDEDSDDNGSDKSFD